MRDKEYKKEGEKERNRKKEWKCENEEGKEEWRVQKKCLEQDKYIQGEKSEATKIAS